MPEDSRHLEAQGPVEGPAPSPAPAASAPSAAPHIVIVDELPFRSTHVRARELPEHAHGHSKKHGHHGRPYHPAPGIVVDVLDAQGEADATDLQRAARNVGYWPFRHCYEEGLRRDQALTGKVAVDVTVAASGSVERASLASASVKDESVALCVAREAEHFTLGSAKGTARIQVSLATGDEPVPEPRPALHARELRDGLRASWPAVEKCYADELTRHPARYPDAGGRLELRFRVKSDGHILEVGEAADGDRFGDIDVTR